MLQDSQKLGELACFEFLRIGIRDVYRSIEIIANAFWMT